MKYLEIHIDSHKVLNITLMSLQKNIQRNWYLIQTSPLCDKTMTNIDYMPSYVLFMQIATVKAEATTRRGLQYTQLGKLVSDSLNTIGPTRSIIQFTGAIEVHSQATM